MAAKKNSRQSAGRDRNLWQGGGFEDLHSDSSGVQQKDFFVEFARNHAASEAKSRSNPQPEPSRPRGRGSREGREPRSARESDRRGSGARERPSSRRERPPDQRGQGRGAASAPNRRSREPAPRKRRRPMSLFRRRLLIVLALAVMLGGTLFLAESLLLRVTRVSVTGDAVYAEEDILAVCDYEMGDNLLLIPRADREEKLERQLPYIAQAKISIRLPGTVVVHITSAQPVCALSAGGGWYVVGKSGKVLEARSDPPEGFLQVTGLTPHSAQIGEPLGLEGEEQTAAFQEILETIGELGASSELGAAAGFTRLDMSNLEDIRLWYQDRVECLLGGAADLKHKIVYGHGLFDSTRKEAIQPEQTGTLDLSYLEESNRAFFNPGAVTPGSPSATPQPPEVQSGQEGQNGDGQNGDSSSGDGQSGDTGSEGGRGSAIPDEIYRGG